MSATNNVKNNESGTYSGATMSANVDTYSGGFVLPINGFSAGTMGTSLAYGLVMKSDYLYKGPLSVYGHEQMHQDDFPGDSGTTFINDSNILEDYQFGKGVQFNMPRFAFSHDDGPAYLDGNKNDDRFQMILPSGRAYNLENTINDYFEEKAGKQPKPAWYVVESKGVYMAGKALSIGIKTIARAGLAILTIGGSELVRNLFFKDQEDPSITLNMRLFFEEEKLTVDAEITRTLVDNEIVNYTISDVSMKTQGNKIIEFYNDGETYAGSVKKITHLPTGKTTTYYWNNDKTLQKISHSDGKNIKFYYYEVAGKLKMVSLLSTSADMSTIAEDDRFIASYELDGNNKLSSNFKYYKRLKTADVISYDDNFSLNASNELNYFTVQSGIRVDTSISENVTGDNIKITQIDFNGDDGSETKYIFDKKPGFAKVEIGDRMETDPQWVEYPTGWIKTDEYYDAGSNKTIKIIRDDDGNKIGEHIIWGERGETVQVLTDYYLTRDVRYYNIPKVVKIQSKEKTTDTDYSEVEYIHYVNGGKTDAYTSNDGGLDNSWRHWTKAQIDALGDDFQQELKDAVKTSDYVVQILTEKAESITRHVGATTTDFTKSEVQYEYSSSDWDNEDEDKRHGRQLKGPKWQKNYVYKDSQWIFTGGSQTMSWTTMSGGGMVFDNDESKAEYYLPTETKAYRYGDDVNELTTSYTDYDEHGRAVRTRSVYDDDPNDGEIGASQKDIETFSYIKYIDGSCFGPSHTNWGDGNNTDWEQSWPNNNIFDDDPYDLANKAAALTLPVTTHVSAQKSSIGKLGEGKFSRAFTLYNDPDNSISDEVNYIRIYEATTIEESALSSEERFSEYEIYDWVDPSHRDYGYGQPYLMKPEYLASSEREITVSTKYNQMGLRYLVEAPNGNTAETEYFDYGINYGKPKKSKVKIKNNINGKTQYFITEVDGYNILGQSLGSSSYMLDEFGNLYQGEMQDDGTYPYPKVSSHSEYDKLGRKIASYINDIQLNKIEIDEANKTVTSISKYGSIKKAYFDHMYRQVMSEAYRPKGTAFENLDNTIANSVLISKSETYDFHPIFKKAQKGKKYLDPAGTDYVESRTEFDALGRAVKSFTNNTRHPGEKLLSEVIYKEDENEVWTKSYKSETEWKLGRSNPDWLGRSFKSVSYTDWYTDATLDLTTATPATLDALENTIVSTIDEIDLTGKALKVTHPSGEQFETVYDNLGRVEKVIRPDGSFTLMNYDLNGNVIATRDRKGVETFTTYDSANSASKVFVKSIPSISVDHEYCHLGEIKVTKYEDDVAEITTTNVFNRFGQVKLSEQEIDGMKRFVSTTYNPEGKQLDTTVCGFSGWTKSFTNGQRYFGPTGEDTTNRVRSAMYEGIVDPATTTDTPLFINETSFDGVSQLHYQFGGTTTLHNDSDNGFMQLSKIEHPDAESTIEFTSRDWLGQIEQKKQGTDPLDDYVYDSLGRIDEAEGFKYAFDEISNITSVTDIATVQAVKEFTYSEENPMQLANYTKKDTDGNELINWDFYYDEVGNTVEITGRFDRMVYDGSNNLREIQFYPDDMGRVRKDKYWYNLSGHRYKKEEYIGLTTNTEKTYYLYSGNDILMEEKFIGDKPVSAKFNVGRSAQYNVKFDKE
jgi:hypothetical protein